MTSTWTLPSPTYWPEFKAAGKGDIPVRWLLCHKAGLPYVDAVLTLEEALAWEPMVRALEVQAPVWEPGTAHGYHATTYGWLVGEVVKRISGKSLGTFFHDEIAEPLDLEFWIGLPDEQQHRVAPLQQWGSLGGEGGAPRDPALAKMLEQFIGPDSLLGKALGAPNGVFNAADGGFNNPAVRAAEIPAANGVTNARSLARFYAGLTGPVEGGPAAPLLGADQVAKASERADVRPGQVPVLRDHLRPRLLRGVTVRALRGPEGLRPHRRGRLRRVHRSRARHRVRLRDEQDGHEPQR